MERRNLSRFGRDACIRTLRNPPERCRCPTRECSPTQAIRAPMTRHLALSRRSALLLLAFVVACASARPYAATSARTTSRSECAADDWARSNRATACERRLFSLAPDRGPFGFESGNGAVSIEGADSARVASVVALVRAWAPSDAEAARIAAAVEVRADGNTLRAEGPHDLSDDRGWAVDYRVTTPRRADLRARTGNGAVRVRDVVGRMHLSSGNGAITLEGVGGAVDASTGNGAVRATLAGRAWDDGGISGARLDLHSGNGSATLRVPEGYSAALSISTGNGRLAVDFPVTLSGRIDPRHLELTLGTGGAPLRVSTGNGSARLSRVD